MNNNRRSASCTLPLLYIEIISCKTAITVKRAIIPSNIFSIVLMINAGLNLVLFTIIIITKFIRIISNFIFYYRNLEIMINIIIVLKLIHEDNYLYNNYT